MKTASGLAASLACALLLMCNALAAESTHAMRGTRSLAAKGPSGSKLKMLINCFAPYLDNAAHRPDNSNTAGCDEESIVHCRTDAGHDDKFCKFDGTNLLHVSSDTPKCYFNCQMETCNAWETAHNADQQKCVDSL